MILIQVQISDELFQQIQAIAEQKNLPLEQIVEQALAAQVSAWKDTQYLKARGERGSWTHFQQVLAKVPDREPEEFDRLP
jgi:predicted transcriptional regulator